MKFGRNFLTLTARPYQILCIVCFSGEDESAPKDARLGGLLERIRENPDMPVALRCNADDEFSYQNVGAEYDTGEGSEFNKRRDMEILQRLDLAPGAVLPARIIFRRLFKSVTSLSGICGYAAITSEAWRGCPMAGSGRFEKALARGINAVIPPRSLEKTGKEKDKNIKDMLRSGNIKIRPHILLCAAAQYGEGIRPPYAPDNLPEMIQYILRKPDTPITLVPGADRMMCGPCPNRVPEFDSCVCGAIGSGGLYNELKDLKVLQVLGLTYGASMKAGALYQLIFDRIPKTEGVCAMDSRIPHLSLWRDGCGENPDLCKYENGRRMLMRHFAN